MAQVGVSGSTKLGQRVILAGQVGLVGHIELGDGVQVGAQSGVSRSVPAGQDVSGSPGLSPSSSGSRAWAISPNSRTSIGD